MTCDTTEGLYVYSGPKTSNNSPSGLFQWYREVRKSRNLGSNHGFLSFSAPRLGGDEMPYI